MTPTNLRLHRSIFALTAALAVSACQDSVAPEPAPVSEEIDMPDMRIFATYAPDNSSADIRVMPSGGWFVIGRHAVHFPRRAICELGSSYGPTEWDKPCEPARGPVDFHVEVMKDADGRTWLDVTPAARFVPSSRKSGWVMLYMWTGLDSEILRHSEPPILWSPAFGVPGIDESLEDPTLRTRYMPGTSIAYRRIKHFSGYNVGVGMMDNGEELGGEMESEMEGLGAVYP